MTVTVDGGGVHDGSTITRYFGFAKWPHCPMLKSLPLAEQFLKPGITFQQLDVQATVTSDNKAAKRLNNARERLSTLFFNRSKTAA
jgi:hypothetical protein